MLSTLGILVQGGVRFVFSVLVGNAFGKLVLGAANAAISLALFASLVHPSAAAQTATKFVARARGARDFDGLAAAFGPRQVDRCVVGGPGCGRCAGRPRRAGTGAVESVLTGALVIAYSGYMFTRGVLFGSGSVQRATVWDLISSAVSLSALAAVVLAGETAWILLPLVLGYAVYVAANLPRRSRMRVPAELRREMNGFLGLTLVNSLATGGFLQLSMVAAQYWDPEGAGAFAGPHAGDPGVPRLTLPQPGAPAQPRHGIRPWGPRLGAPADRHLDTGAGRRQPGVVRAADAAQPHPHQPLLPPRRVRRGGDPAADPAGSVDGAQRRHRRHQQPAHPQAARAS